MRHEHLQTRFISVVRGLIGIIFLLGISWLLSSAKSFIKWRLILTGIAVQVLIALAILYVPFVGSLFSFIGKLFIKILDSAQAGSVFIGWSGSGCSGIRETGSYFCVPDSSNHHFLLCVDECHVLPGHHTVYR